MPTRHHLPAAHLALAVLIMAVWGTNFVVIKFALAHLPPLTLALTVTTALAVGTPPRWAE